MEKNNGITLVALVITVVIMLILAGVAIGSVTGDGLFSKTRDAVGAYENATRKEADQMQALMNEIDEYLTGGNGGEENQTSGVAPETVAKIGDFVNYSVEVDGVTYDKWRILDFDNNGNMEIVCYNGPEFTMSGKSDYVNAIEILNNESLPYGNGTYGNSTRHLGSDPSNPSSYATISISYVKYYSNNDIYNNPTTNLAYLEQEHHESDVNAIKSFSNTADGKKLAGSYSWLGSRYVVAVSSRSSFGVLYVTSSGTLTLNYLYCVYSNDSENALSPSRALAPVVSLESGVKINTSSAGNGSEDSPWQLTK